MGNLFGSSSVSEELPYHDYEVNHKNEDDLKKGLFHVYKLVFAEEATEMKTIQGGITNLLYLVTGTQKCGLFRIYGQKTELLIDRKIENKVFQALSKQGQAPPLYALFKNGRVEGFVKNSRPLEPQEMGEEEFLEKIAPAFSEFHQCDLSKVLDPTTPKLWDTVEKFIKLASEAEFTDPDKKAKIEALNIDQLKKELPWLKSILPSELNGHGKDLIQSAENEDIKKAMELLYAVVPCHNDLLSGNILYRTDKDDVLFIDYEYASYSYRGFDIANHFNEFAGFDCNFDKWYPKIPVQKQFYELYFEKMDMTLSDATLDQCVRIIDAFALVDHFFWGFWGVVQACNSPIDFDFAQYAKERLTRYPVDKEQFKSA